MQRSGGTGFSFNNDYSRVTGGTVTGYFEEHENGANGGDWIDGWLVQNFSYSAVALAQAAYSAGTTVVPAPTGLPALRGTTASSSTASSAPAGADKLAFSQAALKLGDGDTAVEGVAVHASPGGFSPSLRAGDLQRRAAGVDRDRGSFGHRLGQQCLRRGKTALFAVDNGASTALYLFTAAGHDALVSAGELKLLATLAGTPSTATADYLFVA